MHIGTNSKKLDISSEINTKKVSERFAEFLKPGDLVCLFGDLGVGKTTFIKYLINYLQKKFQENTTEVSSPTFIEWPEIISKNLKDFISLNFRYENDFDKRSITISTNKKNIINEF